MIKETEIFHIKRDNLLQDEMIITELESSGELAFEFHVFYGVSKKSREIVLGEDEVKRMIKILLERIETPTA